MFQPLVTVIMPIRNEENFITQSLGAVLEQNYPQEKLEILIADGMSDDATIEVIRSMPITDRVRIISNPQRIQAAGLNQAILQAKGDIIIRVDGHAVIASDYVQKCVDALHSIDAQNVGGPMNPVGITPMGKAIAAAGKSPFAVPTAFHISQKAQFTDTVYLGAWKREIFDQVGLYNEKVNINEDYELNYRIRKSGGKIYFTPTIQSQYYGRQTLRALARQYFIYGQTKIKVLWLFPASVKPRQLVAPLFVLGLTAGAIISKTHSNLRKIWVLSILLYTLTNLFFSVKTAFQTQLKYFWRLPVIFLTIHLSWGIGFWIELFKIIKQRLQSL